MAPDQLNNAIVTYTHDGTSPSGSLLLFATNLDNPLTVLRRVNFQVVPAGTIVHAVPDFFITLEDTLATFDLIGNDLKNGTTNVIQPPEGSSTTAQGGSLNRTGNTFTYSPALNFWGIDSFVYDIHDPISGQSGGTQVQINVIPVNDPPQANDVSTSAQEDGAAVNDSFDADDVDDDPGSPLTNPIRKLHPRRV